MQATVVKRGFSHFAACLCTFPNLFTHSIHSHSRLASLCPIQTLASALLWTECIFYLDRIGLTLIPFRCKVKEVI